MSRLARYVLPLSLSVCGVAHADPPAHDSGAAKLAASCGQSRQRLPFAADFAPYVGTSSSEIGREGVRHFSFNLVGGYAGGLRGFEVGSVFNLERDCVEGFQVAGVLNASGGDVRGVQVAGAVNLTHASVRGLEVAGAANVTGALDAGLQVAGAANVALGDVKGMQVSGGANLAHGFVRGLQVAGALNLGTGPLSGAQIAGGLNFTSSDVTGLQLAPLNFASGTVRGTQIGVVNIAEKSDLSLGVVSINTRGRTQVEAWTAVETGLLAAALKHGGDHWHGLYGLGTRLADPELALVLGLGGDAPLGEHLYIGGDVVGYWTPRFEDSHKMNSLIQPRAYLGVRILKQLSVFGGASYNVSLSDRRADNWAPSYAEQVNTSGDPRVRLWPGAVFGLRLLPE